MGPRHRRLHPTNPYYQRPNEVKKGVEKRKNVKAKRRSVLKYPTGLCENNVGRNSSKDREGTPTQGQGERSQTSRGKRKQIKQGPGPEPAKAEANCQGRDEGKKWNARKTPFGGTETTTHCGAKREKARGGAPAKKTLRKTAAGYPNEQGKGKKGDLLEKRGRGKDEAAEIGRKGLSQGSKGRKGE